jgi:hypothetical protein
MRSLGRFSNIRGRLRTVSFTCPLQMLLFRVPSFGFEIRKEDRATLHRGLERGEGTRFAKPSRFVTAAPNQPTLFMRLLCRGRGLQVNAGASNFCRLRYEDHGPPANHITQQPREFFYDVSGIDKQGHARSF